MANLKDKASLNWSNIDLASGALVLLKTKNNERRRVTLRGHAFELLKAHAKVQHIGTDFLFPGEKPSYKKDCIKVDRLARHIIIENPWNKALKAANLHELKNDSGKVIREGFRFQDLRHSCASYLAMNGASPLEIAEVLGHKTLQMVKLYAHLGESHTASVVEKMNKKIFG